MGDFRLTLHAVKRLIGDECHIFAALSKYYINDRLNFKQGGDFAFVRFDFVYSGGAAAPRCEVIEISFNIARCDINNGRRDICLACKCAYNVGGNSVDVAMIAKRYSRLRYSLVGNYKIALFALL